MTCQSLFGVGDGEAVGLAEVFAVLLPDDFEDDLDFAKVPETRPRHRTPAINRKRSRAFIINRGAGWVPELYRMREGKWSEGEAFKKIGLRQAYGGGRQGAALYKQP